MTAQTPATTARHFIDSLVEIGVDFIFANFGTDHAPLIEELAARGLDAAATPQVVLCPHESLAMHMAGGYAMATGRAQLVVVHVDAGTANAAMAAHNLARSRVPVILFAGRAPYGSRAEQRGSRDNYVHFIQEPFDQASIVRPYVKWEHGLPTGRVVKEVLRRAHSVAMSDPCGPVYLTASREVLAEACGEAAGAAWPASQHGPRRYAGAEQAQVEALAARLLRAESPLLITSYAGRDPETPAALAELAEFTGLRVVEAHPLHHSMPHDHVCHGGFAAGDHVARADLGLLVDTDVPWIPADTPHDPRTWWAHVDVDPMKHDLPMWPFPANERITGDSGRVIRQLLQACRAMADDRSRALARDRLRGLEQDHAARRARAAQAAASPGERGAINPHAFLAALQARLGPQTIVVNEAVRNSPAVTLQMPRTVAGTYFANAGGGLGHSGGAALGLKLAHPGRDVVQIVGDGAFYLGSPASTFATAQRCSLPILTVVLDNGGWAAVKSATLRVYPDGAAQRAGDFQSDLGGGTDFSLIARAAGAHGAVVDDPAAVEEAIATAVAALRGGRSALLHVRIPPF